eukprot:scaffold14981_cov90-Cylindrotheca_fusiformis.AAC.2
MLFFKNLAKSGEECSMIHVEYVEPTQPENGRVRWKPGVMAPVGYLGRKKLTHISLLLASGCRFTVVKFVSHDPPLNIRTTGPSEGLVRVAL